MEPQEQNAPQNNGSIFNEPEPKKKSRKLAVVLTFIFITLLSTSGTASVWYWQEQEKSALKAESDTRVAELEQQKEDIDKQLTELKEKNSTKDEAKTDIKKVISKSKIPLTTTKNTKITGWKTYNHISNPKISLQYPGTLPMHRSQAGDTKKILFNNNMSLTFRPTTETSIDNYLKIDHGVQIPLEGDTFDKIQIGKGITAAIYDPYNGLPLGGDIYVGLAFIKNGYVFTINYQTFPDDRKLDIYRKIISTLDVK